MASAATISGLASGIEWQDTIDLMMQIESQPMERILDRRDETERKQSSWDSLEAKLATLQSRSQAMDTYNSLLKKSATSSDTDTVTAKANATAVPSTHTIEVNQLANNEILVHDGVADENSSALQTGGGGSFSFTYYDDDDEAYRDVTFDVPSGTTLAGLVQLINNNEDNGGVAASYIDDGSGGATAFHLVLTGLETGSSHTITINDANTSLSGAVFDSLSYTTTQSASDAQIRIDNYPPASWITRESNTIDDALTGVTFNLLDTTGGSTVSLVIDNDFTAVKTEIGDWVSAYNDIMQEIAAVTTFDPENEVQGILSGDSRVQMIRNTLLDYVVSQVPGLATDAKYYNLSSIGITPGADGVLSVNDADLQEALENDQEDVADLFVFTSSTDDPAISYFNRTSATEGGYYDVEVYYNAAGNINPNKNNTIGGYAATVSNGIYLVGKEDTPVEGLRLKFSDPGGGPGQVSATVRIGTGVSIMIDNKVEDYTDYVDGLLKLIDDSYKTEIESYDDQLEQYEIRLEIKREQLTRKFLAMEDATSEAKTQSSWLSSI